IVGTPHARGPTNHLTDCFQLNSAGLRSNPVIHPAAKTRFWILTPKKETEMGNINMGRVILGGLVAGLVLNIGEFLLNGVVLASQMKAFNAQHNFADPGNNFLIMAVLLTFLLGIVLVLGYAAIRPRFGPGVKTAIIASLFAWFGIYFY